jgi:hypothetical protein
MNDSGRPPEPFGDLSSVVHLEHQAISNRDVSEYRILRRP